MNANQQSATPAVAGSVPQGSSQQGWTIALQRSTLAFSLRHIVVRRIAGRFLQWGGTLFVDRNQPSLSTVDVWVELATITTDDADRDQHVRSAEFLDVERFPQARFQSGLVEVRGQDLIVHGRLDLHGVVHDVEVHVQVGPQTIGPDGRACMHFTAHATLDCQSFGLHWNQDLDVGGIVVGDDVEVQASVELVQA